ncbi:NADH dehydrogenase [ubiquinone] 1 alpha subcomplex subunit 7-like [Athalia rosae]|uniref:NADH dehydrogenase [ubiquinone] 1 alpha subcomplex subunit 7-like n=1 Tax=Athalia rosae TaxID=37344 RepID=UPI002033F828|nr:NADH dehydrogenase [ubiquinone] 1 alpha subcomplex subunit 7-like [Athalia rosae]XP_048507192.1 NADH dehydrogenase [ubiquinone] 1 alpha subcomplex subunit 7-like [Athalia rosae]
MPGPVEHRSASGLISLIQKWLRGSSYKTTLRFADEIAARTQPPPNLPLGPYHKTSKIYYYTRDARREVGPSTIISTSRQIGSPSQVSTQIKLITPGKVLHLE